MKDAPAVGLKSWRQGAFLAVLLCAAVGASAAVSMSKSWRLTRDDGTGTTSVTMTETPDGVDLLTWGRSRFEAVKLTKEEAASLGRALLEAAGEPEKVCPAVQFAPYNNGETKVCTCNSVVGGTCDCWNVGDVKP